MWGITPISGERYRIFSQIPEVWANLSEKSPGKSRGFGLRCGYVAAAVITISPVTEMISMELSLYAQEVISTPPMVTVTESRE